MSRRMSGIGRGVVVITCRGRAPRRSVEHQGGQAAFHLRQIGDAEPQVGRLEAGEIAHHAVDRGVDGHGIVDLYGFVLAPSFHMQSRDPKLREAAIAGGRHLGELRKCFLGVVCLALLLEAHGSDHLSAMQGGRIRAALEPMRVAPDACENGHDHDADPVTVHLEHSGQTVDLSAFSRRRVVNADSSFTVMG